LLRHKLLSIQEHRRLNQPKNLAITTRNISKMNQYKQLIYATFLLTLMSACSKAPSINSGVENELTGKWQLETVVQENKTLTKSGSKQGMYDVSITFRENGELEATSANNYLTGFYETSQQNSIQLGGDGTERSETTWGEIFINALPNVNQYDLTADRLILFYDQNNKLIFSRVSQEEPKVTASRLGRQIWSSSQI
jgi:hypothetical protein